MIATIPPLWRDVDAYNQATRDPLLATFWGHGPAYCYIVKTPLFAAEQLARWQGNTPARQESNPSQPSLTDSGVWLLIVCQHLALGGAALYFILAISEFFWVRLALALAWVSNALFYAFAHCVGSETLSMILVLLVVAKGLRLIQSRHELQWMDWYVFAIVLWLCILSRHIDLCLIGLLPAGFLLSWARNRAFGIVTSNDRQKLWLRRSAARDLRQAVIAIGIGIACFAVANLSIQGLARKSRLHPHSRVGFTFLWRLQFVKNLSPESRAEFFRKASSRTHSSESRKLIALLQEMDAEGADFLNWGPFMQKGIQLFHGPLHWEDLDRALNKMAFAFLVPPAPELLHAARTDFVAGLKAPATEITSYLFETTAYYFQHKDDMPACAELVTFRNRNADQLRIIPSHHFYFRLWREVSYNQALLIWFIALLAFLVMARWRKINVSEISAFGITLTAIGLLMFASTCFLADSQPRFRLPMWQLLMLSSLVFFGGTADLLTRGGSKWSRPALRPL
jgi:hypothetical protein